MRAKRLLLSITLLGFIYGATSKIIADPLPPASQYKNLVKSEPNTKLKCHHFMLVSNVLRNGQTGQACIFITCEEAVNLKVIMEYQISKTPIFNKRISSFPFFDCRSFPVPTVYTLPLLVYIELSLTGKTEETKERKAVVVDKMPEACFVQVEKTQFKRGDIVRTRVFCLNHDLKPIKQNFTIARFREPTGAYIQIVELKSKYYVASAEVKLSEDAATGTYSIIYERENGDPVIRYVQVQDYRLPRFDTKVNCPNTLSVLTKSAKIEMSARYVYDKPLPATFLGKCCRNVAYTYGTTKNCYTGLNDICMEFAGKLDGNGAYTQELNMNDFKLQLSEYDSSIQCTITIKEDGTEVLDTKYCYMYITNQPANLQLDYSYLDEYYRHGLHYLFAVVLTDDQHEPMANEDITIEVDSQPVKIVKTDANGRAECAIDTTPYNKPNITLRAIYSNENQCYIPNQSRWSPVGYNSYDPGYPYAEIVVKRFFSETDSFLKMRKLKGELACFETHRIVVDYKVTEAAVGKEATSTTFLYLVKAREQIVLYGKQKVYLTKGFKGSFFFDMLVTPKFAKSTKILVYGAAETEIIADSQSVTISSCFENKVSLAFTESVVVPGSEVTRELTAASGSFCGLRARDASLDLIGSYDSLNADNLFYSLQYYMSYQAGQFDLKDPDPPCEDPDKEVFCNGRHYKPVSNPMDGDTNVFLTDMNMRTWTDYRVKKPQVCGMESIEPPYVVPVFANANAGPVRKTNTLQAGASFVSADIVTFRENFADTFGWDATFVGPDGKGTVTNLIPDTITEWYTDMFCLSSHKGVGLSNRAAIITYLPFLTELTMPAVCTRGEKLVLVTSAKNHEDNCKQVVMRVTASDDSQAVPLQDVGNHCICKGETVSMRWSMHLTSLGEVTITASSATISISKSCDGANDDSIPSREDIVRKNITVKAEGISQQVTFSRLQIVRDSTVEDEVTIEEPNQLVKDSFKLEFVVVGDPMGLMVNNLDNLLNQPDGCCEQNLGRMLPIAYLLTYFNETGGLSNELYEKGKSLLSAAYARQLACRSYNGQYSIFPGGTFVYNSWLNINTFYTFEKCKPFIYIDQNVQQETLNQLGRTQDLTTGCFAPTGSLFTIPDAKNATTLYTAYVAKRLLQSELYGIGGTMLEGALRCIQNADLKSLNTYALAYIYLVAALAKLEIWYKVKDILKARAINEGVTVHWRNEGTSPGKSYYFLPKVYPSSDVDMTACIMLGFLYGPEQNQEMINFVSLIATWIYFNQNSNGGFRSPQDTSSAVEAMTVYRRKVYFGKSNCEVVLHQGDKEVTRVAVQEDNKILLHRILLQTVFGPYKMTTFGTCAPLVQLSTKFNMKVTNEGSPFSMNVTTRAKSCTDGVAQVIYIDYCGRYHGSQSKTSIVLIDKKPLTGYSIDQGSVTTNSPEGSQYSVQMKDEHALIYLSEMDADTDYCFTTTMYINTQALLYQSSSVTTQDLSNPENSAYASYSYPCSSSALE